MTDDRVIALIEAYGGDPARWPEAERAAALARLKQSVRLKAAQAEAAELDRLLSFPAHAMPSLAAARLETKVLAHQDTLNRNRGRRAQGQWASLAFSQWGSLAAACVFGIVIGFATPSGVSEADADQWLHEVGLAGDLVAWQSGDGI